MGTLHYIIATLGPTWKFQLCFKSCKLTSWTTTWLWNVRGTSQPATHPPTASIIFLTSRKARKLKFSGCLVSVERVSGGCLKGVWRFLGRSLEVFWLVLPGYKKSVSDNFQQYPWQTLGNCTDSFDIAATTANLVNFKEEVICRTHPANSDIRIRPSCWEKKYIQYLYLLKYFYKDIHFLFSLANRLWKILMY